MFYLSRSPQKILDYRAKKVAFGSLHELDAVPGIGPAGWSGSRKCSSCESARETDRGARPGSTPPRGLARDGARTPRRVVGSVRLADLDLSFLADHVTTSERALDLVC